MPLSAQRRRVFRILPAIALVVTACDNPSTATGPGLANEYDVRRVVATDSAGTPLPAPQQNPVGPGSFHGFVRASAGAVGTDTLATSTRIAGVIVRAIPLLNSAAPGTPRDGSVGPATIPPGAGPIAATVTTDARGAFELPTLPGGRYMVTFQPPGNDYAWSWVLATASPIGGNLPWWVTLPRR